MKKTIHRPEYQALLMRLRDARRDAGLTQVELSEVLGVGQSFVSDIERGSRRLDVLELRTVCQALGTDFVDFIAALEAEIAPLPTTRKRAGAHARSRRK